MSSASLHWSSSAIRSASVTSEGKIVSNGSDTDDCGRFLFHPHIDLASGIRADEDNGQARPVAIHRCDARSHLRSDCFRQSETVDSFNHCSPQFENTTVFAPFKRMRSSVNKDTARASTRRSISRPF